MNLLVECGHQLGELGESRAEQRDLGVDVVRAVLGRETNVIVGSRGLGQTGRMSGRVIYRRYIPQAAVDAALEMETLLADPDATVEQMRPVAQRLTDAALQMRRRAAARDAEHAAWLATQEGGA